MLKNVELTERQKMFDVGAEELYLLTYSLMKTLIGCKDCRVDVSVTLVEILDITL